MGLTKTSAKGQVVIPAAIREKFGIRPGSVVDIREVDGRIVLEPVPDDPIRAAYGMLRGGPSLLEALLKERAAEREREDRDEQQLRAR